VHKVIAMSKYLCGAEISNYQLSNEHKLVLALLSDGENWRAHDKQVFHYSDGAWVMCEKMQVEAWHLFTALEGAWISVQEQPMDAWSWDQFKNTIINTISRLAGQGQAPMAYFASVAKENSDVLRKNTEGKVWKAPWYLRIAELVSTFKKSLEMPATNSHITKLFLSRCDTKMPRSKGFCFPDAYMSEDWSEKPKHRDNDCYFRLPYRYNLVAADIEKTGMTLAELDNKLDTFLRGLYYDNSPVLTLKLCFLKLCFQKVPSGKMVFDIGHGGDGKGMEAMLEKSLLGEANFATLDCSCLVDRQDTWCKMSTNTASNNHLVHFQFLTFSPSRNAYLREGIRMFSF
jgi:hypothetical protein